MSWWFLSFSKGPPPDGFLGGLVIEGERFTSVVCETWARGLNPGGEVVGYDVSGALPPPVDLRYRLLTWHECELVDAWWATHMLPMGVPLRPPAMLDAANNTNPETDPQNTGPGS